MGSPKELSKDREMVELDQEQWRAEIENQTQTLLNSTVEDFTIALSVGKADRSDWRVEYLAGLIEKTA